MDNLNPRTKRARSALLGPGRRSTVTFGRPPSWSPVSFTGYQAVSEQVSTLDTAWPKLQHYKRKYPNSAAIAHALRVLDLGTNFTLDRDKRTPLYHSVALRRNYMNAADYRYEGPICVGLPNATLRQSVMQNLFWPSEDVLNAILLSQGTSSIARSNPFKAQNEILVGLIELFREGLPKVMGMQSLAAESRGGLTRSLGSEYLNVTFGWEPLIADIMSCIEIVNRGHILISRYHEMRGNEQRVKYNFPLDTSTESYNRSGGNVSAYGPQSGLIAGASVSEPLHISRRVTQRTWFSGAFDQYLPIDEDFVSKSQEIKDVVNYVTGVRLSPDLLWELMPWSWLIDWFTNVGDILSNISYIGDDNVVLRYGYIMQHTSVSATVSLPNIRPFDKNAPVSETFLVERKARRKSTPYGFGLDPGAFSPKQWSILAALGMSRSPGRII